MKTPMARNGNVVCVSGMNLPIYPSHIISAECWSHRGLKMLSVVVGSIVVILARISLTGHRASADTPYRFRPGLAEHVRVKIYISHILRHENAPACH